MIGPPEVRRTFCLNAYAALRCCFSCLYNLFINPFALNVYFFITFLFFLVLFKLFFDVSILLCPSFPSLTITLLLFLLCLCLVSSFSTQRPATRLAVA